MNSQAQVESIGLVKPEHEIQQNEARTIVQQWLDESAGDPPMSEEKLDRLFRNAGVRTRNSIHGVEEILEERDFGTKSRLYREHGQELGVRAVNRVLNQAGLRARDVDMLITTSCTGFTIPSLDALVMNEVDFRDDLKRLPIAELGCGAGASALCRAHDYLKGHPADRVLILSVELCTLNFQPTDRSKTQLVSSAIFGDGAAATLLSGRDVATTESTRPALMEYRTGFSEETLNFMGYENTDRGMHIQLSPKIPAYVKRNVRGFVEDFLADQDLDPDQIDHWILHPGGRAILDAVDDQLELNGQLDPSRAVLREHGNLSSATIFYVLDRVHRQKIDPGDRGLMMAFGPGFTVDVGLLEWNNVPAKPARNDVSAMGKKG